MNRAIAVLYAILCCVVLPGLVHAQEAAPTLYPIDEKGEPLLASIKRLNLFAKGEEVHILRYNPSRKDTPVCRLDKEGKTVKLDKLPGTQVRLAYAIAAGIGEEEKLDAKAKKQLTSSITTYKIHTFDEFGVITRSRLPKDEDEALRQVNLDVDGAHHFRKLADHAKKRLSQ